MFRFCLLFVGVAFFEKLDTILKQKKQPILRLKMSILTELHVPSYAAILRFKMAADIVPFFGTFLTPSSCSIVFSNTVYTPI